MTLSLLRREPAVRKLVWYLPSSILVGLVVWLLMGRNADQGFYPALILVWAWLMGFMLNSGISSHCSNDLELALPIPARKLWLAHVGAIVGSGVVLLLLAGATVALGNAISGIRSALDPTLIGVGIHLGVASLLALALVQSPRPYLYEVPFRPRHTVFFIVVVAGYLGLVLLLGKRPPVYSLGPLGVALVLGLQVYRSIPESFTVAPLHPSGGAVSIVANVPLDRSERGLGRVWRSNHAIFRSLVGRWVWFYPAILAFQGIILAASGTDSVRISYVFLALTILLSWAMVVLGKLFVIDPLPLSRRRVFAVLFLPMLFALALGYGAGARGNALFSKVEPDVRHERNECCSGVHVPHEYWEIAWDGRPPAIDSPWGETWVPAGRPILAGSTAVVYNPFATGEDSSSGFVALQMSRALEAVSGDPVGGRAFLTFFTCVGILFLLIAAAIFRIRRVGLSEQATAYLFAAVFTSILVCGVGLLVTDALSLSNHAAITRMVGITVRHLGESLPGGTPALWCLALLLFGGSYLLAQAEFRRVDAGLPARKPH